MYVCIMYVICNQMYKKQKINLCLRSKPKCFPNFAMLKEGQEANENYKYFEVWMT